MCRNWITLLLLFAASTEPGWSQETGPKKHALLIAVSRYELPSLNRPAPELAEADALALGKELQAAGFTVDFLLGEQATQLAIMAKLSHLRSQANQAGVLLVGLFGHGVEYADTKPDASPVPESYFCPFDSMVHMLRKGNGKEATRPEAKSSTQLDPATLISLGQFLSTLKTSNAKNRILLADCCHSNAQTSRGRSFGSFGSSLTAADLPLKTAVLFACSKDERSFPESSNRHGAFTKCIIDLLRNHSDDDGVTMNDLGDYLKKAVPRMVSSATGGAETQTPVYLCSGSVDLLNSNLPSLLNSITSRSTGMELMLILPGEFKMGSMPADVDQLAREIPHFIRPSLDDELPAHKVRISLPFYMGKFEVTRGQFSKFVAEENYKTEAETAGQGGLGFNESDGTYTQHKKYHWRNPGYAQSDDHPVVNVSWNDAQRFCAWISRRDRVMYRLPTEAEWEYACRAGTTTRHPNGEDPELIAAIGNTLDGTARVKFPKWLTIRKRDGYVTTAPVGSFKPNAFGLHDMIGNVWEWCDDCYDARAYKTRQGTTADPIVKDTGDLRVVRGGAWNFNWGNSRSAKRIGNSASGSSFNGGFRIVCGEIGLNRP